MVAFRKATSNWMEDYRTAMVNNGDSKGARDGISESPCVDFMCCPKSLHMIVMQGPNGENQKDLSIPSMILLVPSREWMGMGEWEYSLSLSLSPSSAINARPSSREREKHWPTLSARAHQQSEFSRHARQPMCGKQRNFTNYWAGRQKKVQKQADHARG